MAARLYPAEACGACTVIHPPHAIVIGTSIDPLGDVDKRAWSYFEHFISGWHRQEGLLFAYKELASGFISRLYSALGQDEPASPAVTGDRIVPLGCYCNHAIKDDWPNKAQVIHG